MTFNNPQKLTINGYSGVAMEPAISPDDAVLFFNNSNDPSVNTDIHYATRGADYLTFDYGGPVGGINTTFLEGCPSISQASDIYFISPRSYAVDFETTYVGSGYANGVVKSASVVTGLSKKLPGWIVMDCSISRDGVTLSFVDAQITNGQVTSAKIAFASKLSLTQFRRVVGYDTLMQHVNDSGLNYAPSLSANGLELFFTRAVSGAAQNMMANRGNLSQPFGSPSVITACTGFVEGPSISSDGRRLYYHARNASGGYDIWVVSR